MNCILTAGTFNIHISGLATPWPNECGTCPMARGFWVLHLRPHFFLTRNDFLIIMRPQIFLIFFDTNDVSTKIQIYNDHIVSKSYWFVLDYKVQYCSKNL